MKQKTLVCFLICWCGTLFIGLDGSAQGTSLKALPTVIEPAPKRPFYMDLPPENQAEAISDAIADNIVRRIDWYAGDSTERPDMTIYHYENLPSILQKEQDKYLWDKFGARWEEFSDSDNVKETFNRLLEVNGEYAENKLVERIANRAVKSFEMELKIYKHSFKTWTKAKIAEIFTAGMMTIDSQTGEPVDKYDNIFEAYGGFFVSNIGNIIGFSGFGGKITSAFSSKMYDKMVTSEPTRKESLKELVREFSKIASQANGRNRAVSSSIKTAESRLKSDIRVAKKQKEPAKHLIFVIDSSGSMSSTDPQRVRVAGLKILLNRLSKDTFVTVIDFDHRTRIAANHLNGHSELMGLKKALNTIDSDGNTHIGKGLRVAIQLARRYNEKMIIFLLTDGQDNGREDVLGIANSVSGSIPIYTVGLTGKVNEKLLSKIADMTLGRYFKATSFQHLFSKLNALLGEVNQETTLLSSVGRILMGDVQEKIFTVDKSIKRLSVILSWFGSRIDIEIVKPDGQVITEKNAANLGMEYFRNRNTIIVVSDTAQAGEWKLRLHGTDIPAEGESYNCCVQAVSDFVPQINIKNLYILGSSIPAKVYCNPEKVSQYNVQTFVEDPKGKKQEVSESETYRAILEGDYKLTSRISGHLADGEKFSRILRKEFHVGLPDSKSLKIPVVDMVMRWIPCGNFIMGSDEGKPDEHPAHEVIITKGFWMAESEVTQSMWEKIMGTNPSIFQSGQNYPVEGVSYADCRLFLRNLTAISGTTCRLPTEAEWEYACRAGTRTKYLWGDKVFPDHVRIDDEWSLGPSSVQMFAPNQWGLYDMHSNVWEWCSDWYREEYYSESNPIDPSGPNEGIYRVARGGAWSYGKDDMRSAKRTAILPTRRLGNLGFRFVVSDKN